MNEFFLNSYWIGLDGFSGPGADEVLQAGVDRALFGSSAASFYLWHQWAPSTKVVISNLAVAPGDSIVVTMTATPGAGASNATVYFANTTSGASLTY